MTGLAWKLREFASRWNLEKERRTPKFTKIRPLLVGLCVRAHRRMGQSDFNAQCDNLSTADDGLGDLSTADDGVGDLSTADEGLGDLSTADEGLGDLSTADDGARRGGDLSSADDGARRGGI